MTNEELIREFLSKWRHHKRRMYAHEILTEDDLLPDDMWLEKHLTVITTAHQKELQKAREEERAAFKDLVELWFLRLRTEPMQWRVEQAMKSVFGSQE